MCIQMFRSEIVYWGEGRSSHGNSRVQCMRVRGSRSLPAGMKRCRGRDRGVGKAKRQRAGLGEANARWFRDAVIRSGKHKVGLVIGTRVRRPG